MNSEKTNAEKRKIVPLLTRGSSGIPKPAAKVVSKKKIEANRRNSRHSTGPKTASGKATSRLNAVTHGLLAKEVVITRGDYPEDPEEFARLHEGLIEDLKPVGVAEELEVQKIAICYWRKKRALRCEHGAIRRATGDMQGEEEHLRGEMFDYALRSEQDLEESSRGIGYLIQELKEAKRQVTTGTIARDTVATLRKHFPGDFALFDDTTSGAQFVRGALEGSPEYMQKVVNTIDRQLARLRPLREQLAERETLAHDSKVKAAALPDPGEVDKLGRYEASIERELDRALKRLEWLQKRRLK